jgi:hypothetical protein
MKTGDFVIILLCVIALIGFAVFLSVLPAPGPGPVDQTNYDRITNGMDIVQVTEILGEGEILCFDNHSMVVMKYTGPDIEIKVIFIEGVVYQKCLEQNGVVTSPDGDFIIPVGLTPPPETEL